MDLSSSEIHTFPIYLFATPTIAAEAEVLLSGHSPRSIMACADVDMDIHGEAEPSGADCNEADDIWCFRPVEMTPESQRSLHELLQKQPVVFGVRKSTIITASF